MLAEPMLPCVQGNPHLGSDRGVLAGFASWLLVDGATLVKAPFSTRHNRSNLGAGLMFALHLDAWYMTHSQQVELGARGLPAAT